jgi:mono/diheme cytochrome c family protein
MSKLTFFRPFRGRAIGPCRPALALLLAVAACVPGVTPVEVPPLPPQPPGTGGFPPPPPVPPPHGGSSGGSLPGPVVSAAEPPPALSGGTLLVLSDGKTAFAADPDRDLLYFADLVSERLLATVSLKAGDEPGRAIETRDGTLLVVLRGAGAVVEVDPVTHQIFDRAPVCGAPRGIDHDPTTGRTHVACATGELVTLAAGTLQVSRRVLLDGDLRDVVQSGDKLLVTRFRSAELLVLSAEDGRLLERRKAPGSPAANRMISLERTGMIRAAEPGVAWRMRRGPAGGVVVLHQESANNELGTETGGYGGGPCRSAMGAALSEFLPQPGAAHTGPQLSLAILPVDFALTRDNRNLAVVAAGNESGISRGQSVLFMSSDQSRSPGDCVPPQPPGEPIEFRQPVGRPIAVAFDGQDRVVVQTRDPARLEIISHRGGTIKLSDIGRADTGHQVFHLATGFGLACASCHPEGGEDGRTWRFAKLGLRRTQSLRGGILATAPFHWDGEMRDLRQLMTEVFTGRMGGPRLESAQVEALARWMDRLPALPPAPILNTAAVEHGKALFSDGKVGCATCHNGPALTNNATVSVGTGRALQVPGLRGLRDRAPYLHNGCAPTLLDRFTAGCGGGDQHGVTSHLSLADLADLAAYLESL